LDSSLAVLRTACTTNLGSIPLRIPDTDNASITVPATSTSPAEPVVWLVCSRTSDLRWSSSGTTCAMSHSAPSWWPLWWAGVDEELAGIDPADLVAQRDAVLTALLAAKSRTNLP
jgi:hypothetical protein